MATANNLQLLREASGETRLDLGAALGLSRAQVGRWERGAEPIPPELVHPLARRYGVTDAFLLGVDEPLSPRFGREEFLARFGGDR